MITSSFERLPLFERRPAITILLAVATGIAVGSASEAPSILLRIQLLVLPVLLCTAFFLRKHSVYLLASTLLASVAFGIILMTASLVKDERSLLAQFGDGNDEVTLIGEIDNVHEADHIFIRLTCDSVVSEDIRYAVEKEAAGIFLQATDASERIAFTRGMKVRVFGSLAAFVPRRNPYAFDFDGYLRSTENIDAMMYCDSYYDIRVIGHAAPTFYNKTLDFFSELRITAKAAISNIVADTLVRGFILAMVLGERKALPDTIWEDFQQAGLSHILVVSGFNLGLIALSFHILLRLLRLGRREVRIALVMAATLFYGALIGPQPSVIRAVIVVEFILLSRLLERRSDLTNITAGAALIDLALAPANLFNVSFQLSYGAVFSLTLIAPALDRFFLPDREKPYRQWHMIFVKGAVGTAAVLLGTLPIVLFHFHQVSVISIVTNLLTIPLASIATILSVLLIPLAAIGSAIASLYVDAIAAIIYSIRSIASFAKDIPFAVIRLPHPSVVFILLYVLGLLYIVRALTRRTAAVRVAVTTILVLSISGTGLGLTSTYIKDGVLSVLFFDVGQGDATLIATPNGKYYLIDAGGITRTGKSIAERAIVPFLEAEQIATIDAAFATHMHLDHYGGLVQLSSERPIDTLYSCGGRAASTYASTLDSIVNAKRLPVNYLKGGTSIRLDDEVTAYILSPAAVSQEASNDLSLVMKIVYRNTSVLLLADISSAAEESLVLQYGKFLRSDIVKVAHHGSLSSSSPVLIAEAHPQYAVFSCGRHNRHGHPHQEVVERWRSGKATISRTDREGAILFHSDGNMFEQADWR